MKLDGVISFQFNCTMSLLLKSVLKGVAVSVWQANGENINGMTNKLHGCSVNSKLASFTGLE